LIFEVTIIFYPFNFIDMKKLCALISNVNAWWLEWTTSSSSLVSNKTLLFGLVVALVLLLFKLGDVQNGHANLTELVGLGALLLLLVGRPLLEALWKKSGIGRKNRYERFVVPLVAAKLIYAALELKTGLGYAVVGIVAGIVISYAYLLYQEREMVRQDDQGATV